MFDTIYYRKGIMEYKITFFFFGRRETSISPLKLVLSHLSDRRCCHTTRKPRTIKTQRSPKTPSTTPQVKSSVGVLTSFARTAIIYLFILL